MLLRVMYRDQSYDFIKATRLNEFIEAGTLAMFQRSGGWARVVIDPIWTKNTTSSYNGAERRQSQVV
jgi:hypothetical protein